MKPTASNLNIFGPQVLQDFSGHLLPVRLSDINTTFDNTRRGNAGTSRQDHGKRRKVEVD